MAKKKAKKRSRKPKLPPVVANGVYKVQFPTIEELVKRPDFVRYVADETEVQLEHQAIFEGHLGETIVLEADDSLQLYTELDGYEYDENVLKYVKILHTELPKMIKLRSLEFPVSLSNNKVHVECQTISKDDAQKLVTFLQKNLLGE